MLLRRHALRHRSDRSLRPRRPHRRSALRQGTHGVCASPRRSEIRPRWRSSRHSWSKAWRCARGLVGYLGPSRGFLERRAPCQTSTGAVGCDAEGWGSRVRAGDLQPAAAATAVHTHRAGQPCGRRAWSPTVPSVTAVAPRRLCDGQGLSALGVPDKTGDAPATLAPLLPPLSGCSGLRPRASQPCGCPSGPLAAAHPPSALASTWTRAQTCA